jgi:crossover junction endodeoxyribonuclease RuvC
VKVLGIDPGNGGALALLTGQGDLIHVADIPLIADGTKGRPTINAPLLASVIREWGPDRAFIELIGPRPSDSRVAAFSFGRCRGLLEGVLGTLGIPTAMLTTPTWRRAVGLPASASKETARGEAIRRWPGMAALFARVKDDGRAEAALIALAGSLREAANGGVR